jgi:CRP/FNR family transcriptional regulator, cyclic AMP receptor protein
MHNQIDQLCQFKRIVRDLICDESHRSRSIKVVSRAFVYAAGEKDAKVYCIESGQVKLVSFTPEGREYVLAIRNEGDIFGELCLSGELARTEAAVAMRDTCMHAISYDILLEILKSESLLEGMVHYLACCSAQQQETITSLLVANSEQRLAKILLEHTSQYSGNCGCGIAIVPRILHVDLAAMVGTTRSRIGFFLKRFRRCGLIEVNADHSLSIEVEKLKAFVRSSLWTEEPQENPYEFSNTPNTLSFRALESSKK